MALVLAGGSGLALGSETAVAERAAPVASGWGPHGKKLYHFMETAAGRVPRAQPAAGS